MRTVDVKWSTCVDLGEEKNGNNRKYKVGDHVRILKYKNIFAKYYTSNWSEELLWLKNKLKNSVPWTYAVEELHEKEIVGTFC